MTNEEIVLNHIENNRFLGKKPLRFKEPEISGYYYGSDYRADLQKYNNILNSTTVQERVEAIIRFGKATYYESNNDNRIQCRGGARRSTIDIWRIYKYYFPDENIDVFSIMRALYKLVNNGTLNTYRCPNVRKRVFWLGNYTHDYSVRAELGVAISEWEHIGENHE